MIEQQIHVCVQAATGGRLYETSHRISDRTRALELQEKEAEQPQQEDRELIANCLDSDCSDYEICCMINDYYCSGACDVCACDGRRGLGFTAHRELLEKEEKAIKKECTDALQQFAESLKALGNTCLGEPNKIKCGVKLFY